jgi:AraC-like DNA-binding protein
MPHEDPSIDFLMQPLLSLFHAELPIYRFSERVRTELFGILNDIFILKLEHPPSTDLLIHIRFIEFLCILYKYRRQNLYIRKPAVDYITQKIHSLTDYIHTNYSQRLSLKSLAERVYISPYYLSHLFKQITGFTLISYIQMTRVRNAQQLLLTSSLRISDISERCGFTSFPQFNRVFRKFCHISPSQFRDRIYQKNVPFYSDIPIFPEKETKYETE